MSDSTKMLSGETVDYILHHVNQDRSINLYNGMILGRSGGNENFPNDPLISKVHCKIHIQGRQVFIEDLKSSNKTKLNNKEIIPETLVSSPWG